MFVFLLNTVEADDTTLEFQAATFLDEERVQSWGLPRRRGKVGEGPSRSDRP